MEPYITAAMVAVAGATASYTWKRTRDRIGRVLAAMLSIVTAVAVGWAIISFAHNAGPLGRLALLHASDEYAWGQVRAELERSGLDLRPLLDADPAIEEEFRRGAIRLMREFHDDPARTSAAANELGMNLFRKRVAPKAVHGSDASIAGWGQAYSTYLNSLAVASRRSCGEVAMGNTTSLARLGRPIVADANRLVAATVAAYKSSDTRNVLPTEAEMLPIWREILFGAGSRFSERDVQDLGQITVLPPERACDLSLSLMARVMALPPTQRVMALRIALHEAGKG